MRPTPALLPLTAFLGLCAGPATAQQANAVEDAPERRITQASDDSAEIEPLEAGWTISIEPYVGYIGPAGDLRLPSSTTRGGTIELNDLNLDSPRVMPMGRLRARRGKWTLGISGYGFSADDRGAIQENAGQLGEVAYAVGDRLISDLSYESFEVLLSYRAFTHTPPAGSNGRVGLQAGFDVLGGVRLHHASFDVRNDPVIAPAPGTPLTADADELFAEPVVGARMDLVIDERFGIEVESTAGGFAAGDRSSASFSIDAGFSYRPIPAVGMKLGYRLEVFGLASGDGADEFEWTGSMAGLYAGVQISF